MRSSEETDKITRLVIGSAVALYLLALGLPLGHSLALLYLAFAGLLTATTVAVNDKDPHRTRESPISGALKLFLAASLISAVLAADVSRSFKMTMLLFPGALLYYLVAAHYSVERLVEIYLALTCLSLAISMTLLHAAWIGNDSDPTTLMSQVDLVYITVPNDLLLIALIAPFSAALLRIRHSLLAACLVITTLALGFIAIIIYRSNIALLAFLLTTAGAFHSFWLKRTGVALFVLAGSTTLLDGLFGFPLLSKFLNVQVWGNRVPLWLAAWEMFLDSPIWGVGPGGFSILYDRYSLSIEIPSWVIPDPRHAPWAHNLYLETLAERGLMGLSALFAVGIAMTRPWLPKNTTSLVKTHRTAIGWSVCGLAIAGMFELSLLRAWVIALAAILAAIASILQHESWKCT